MGKIKTLNNHRKGLENMKSIDIQTAVKINTGRSVLITETTTTPQGTSSRILHNQDFMQGAPASHNEAHIRRAVLWNSAADLLECLQVAQTLLLELGADQDSPNTMQAIEETIINATSLPMSIDEALLGIGAPRITHNTITHSPNKVREPFRFNEPVSYDATRQQHHEPINSYAGFKQAQAEPTKSQDEIEQEAALAEMRARLNM